MEEERSSSRNSWQDDPESEESEVNMIPDLEHA
jgi:hypothetical protein